MITKKLNFVQPMTLKYYYLVHTKAMERGETTKLLKWIKQNCFPGLVLTSSLCERVRATNKASCLG